MTIRAGIRLLEEEENEVQVLKIASQEGIDSGIAKQLLSFIPSSSRTVRYFPVICQRSRANRKLFRR